MYILMQIKKNKKFRLLTKNKETHDLQVKSRVKVFNRNTRIYLNLLFLVFFFFFKEN